MELFRVITVIYIRYIVKRNPLFLHEIEWKNNGFVFTTPNSMSCLIAKLA